jgi:hypothetical protein
MRNCLQILLSRHYSRILKLVLVPLPRYLTVSCCDDPQACPQQKGGELLEDNPRVPMVDHERLLRYKLGQELPGPLPLVADAKNEEDLPGENRQILGFTEEA